LPIEFKISRHGEASPWRIRLSGDRAIKRELAGFMPPFLSLSNGPLQMKRAFGALPGLEFLEGPENSSSTRDLAPLLTTAVFRAVWN
jgi:hypothetical protein